jgi:hypothetical protein
VNNGWQVANSTLAFERGMSATTGYRRFEEEYRLMLIAAKKNGAKCQAKAQRLKTQNNADAETLTLCRLRWLHKTAFCAVQIYLLAILGTHRPLLGGTLGASQRKLSLSQILTGIF